jgi:RecA-family ATPase
MDGDESKIEEVKPLLRKFDLLVEKTKAALIYVHHDKKGISGFITLDSCF